MHFLSRELLYEHKCESPVMCCRQDVNMDQYKVTFAQACSDPFMFLTFALLSCILSRTCALWICGCTSVTASSTILAGETVRHLTGAEETPSHLKSFLHSGFHF